MALYALPVVGSCLYCFKLWLIGPRKKHKE